MEEEQKKDSGLQEEGQPPRDEAPEGGEQAKKESGLHRLLSDKKFLYAITIVGTLLIALLVILLIVLPSGSKKSKYYVGDQLSNNKTAFCVDSYYETIKMGLSPVTNGSYLVIFVTIENKTDSAMRIKEGDFKLYCGSKKYSITSDAVYYGGDALLLYEEVGAGISKSLTVIFEIPKSTEEADYVLSYSGKGGSYTVNIKEKPAE